ncbi:MAG: hypothetical protein ACOVOO_03335 [Flavobacteriales bacterium]|jgi:hypothetical protein
MAIFKSSFWRSFWSETGRNTGKWISNGVFGIKGWATPKRIITDNTDSSKELLAEVGDAEIKPSLSDDLVRPTLDDRELFELAHGSNIQSQNIQDICSVLDSLLIAAFQAYIDKQDVSILLVKIRLGIKKLEHLGETTLVENYQRELKLLNRKRFYRKLGFIILTIAIIFGFIFVLLLAE